MKRCNLIRNAFIAACLLFFVGVRIDPLGADPMDPVKLIRPSNITSTTIVPDRYLHRWNPITLFFTSDTGPAEGSAEDHPERWIKIDPPHPGAFTWLDRRTLQFRPSEPWSPLSHVDVAFDNRHQSLTVLLPPPVSSIPSHQSDGLPEIEMITLVFNLKVNPNQLRQAIRLEISPLPGVDGLPVHEILGIDMEIKAMENDGSGDQWTYVLTPRVPIPLGQRVALYLKTTLDDPPIECSPIVFRTAEPFSILRAGLQTIRLPIQTKGSRYSRSQALTQSDASDAFYVEFSSKPIDLTLMDVKNLVHFSPAVSHLDFNIRGNLLEIKGEFEQEKLYRAVLKPCSIFDDRRYPLAMTGDSEMYFYFPRRQGYIRWQAGQGIMERFGSRMVPVSASMEDQFDLMIYPVDPLDRRFWPFPKEALSVDETMEPPGPGEEPDLTPDYWRMYISAFDLQRALPLLGSPAVSEFVGTPLEYAKDDATFGLDLSQYLDEISGVNQPGSYLVGMRRLDEPRYRSWMRVQVTDLSLTTVDEYDGVRFYVTSLKSASPVQGALISVEGSQYGGDWENIYQEMTDSQGSAVWNVEGNGNYTIRRIIVENGSDTLILNPADTPDSYVNGHWSEDSSTWLQWTQYDYSYRKPAPEILCHIFTDRPVYRPDEEVHIRGYVRSRDQGKLTIEPMSGSVVIEAPGDFEFRESVELSDTGGFYYRFQRDKLPTGSYRVSFESPDRYRFQSTRFRMEAYRIPQFEVLLHSPDVIGLDSRCDVTLTATYYSGGRAANLPVRWRVTQFPLVWSPPEENGFVYSASQRYSETVLPGNETKLDIEDVTDAQGSTVIHLDPSAELQARPCSYVVEATVTGTDDQTVTSVKKINAMPPFIIGLRAPRFLENPGSVAVDTAVWGPDNKLIPDQPMHVRLLLRQWHSRLRASDFATGAVRYETDTVDREVYSVDAKSTDTISNLKIPVKQAGVYILEIESHDRLGRAQVVSTDFFVAGSEAVSWSKPVSNIFHVVPDKDVYNPGETAQLVLKSPFLTGSVLVAIEAPDRNRYDWIQVANGTATYQLAIENQFAPRFPIHFLLMRGRTGGPSADLPGNIDMDKPQTMAATTWVGVNPVENSVKIQLTCPERARPGTSIDIGISLTDSANKPLPGEVTLWLVDAAVLALGKESRLDPLPDFIKEMFSVLSFHDTRFMPFGFLPVNRSTGGGAGDFEEGSLFDKATVRKNFKSVPYYNPFIRIDSSGKTVIQVELPDDVTVFKIRAKAASGQSRFGYATGQVAVRIPIVVQPSVPRFVRPGDEFSAIATGRVVEGSGGAGSAEIQVEGADIIGDSKMQLDWVEGVPERIEFQVKVPALKTSELLDLESMTSTIRFAVSRSADQAADASETVIPVIMDRQPVFVSRQLELTAGQQETLLVCPENAAIDSCDRSIWLAADPRYLKAVTGMQYLVTYPYGCTEQRISCARALLAFRNLSRLVDRFGGQEMVDDTIRGTLAYIKNVIRSNGLCAYWPGSEGYVSLTAWVFQFLTEASKAGYDVDPKILQQFRRTLEQSLRSDYRYFIDGESYSERSWALFALAQSGFHDAAYAAELARSTQWLNVESASQVAYTLASVRDTPASAKKDLSRVIWDGLNFELRQGKEVYSGLKTGFDDRNFLMLPSETRALASAIRALRKVDPENPRLDVLIDALFTTTEFPDKNTNTSAELLLLLSELDMNSEIKSQPCIIVAETQEGPAEYSVDGNSPLYSFELPGSSRSVILSSKGVPAASEPMALREELSYLPSESGDQIPAKAGGFAVTRSHYRFQTGSKDPELIAIDQPSTRLIYMVGDIIEEHISIVNPSDSNYVAVKIPLAAGVEPMNPNLETSSQDAIPRGHLSLKPDYTMYLDDSVSYFYDFLPKGTFDFYFRVRASTPGLFIQPPAQAEWMYDSSVHGNSAGALVEIKK